MRPEAAIRAAEFPPDAATVRALFTEYAEGLGVDLCFQGFDEELAGLPGKYARPAGCVLLAWSGREAVGCVAMRPIDASRCEMKRLYVRPGARGGLGRQLVERVCAEARAAGYRQICLDTLPSMVAAARLYESMGFAPIDPYVFNPVAGVRFLGLELMQA
ncbi:GNAT family N-acetyltransferase [Burkholderiaceae bacterium FT117]|uniref:GNAT family N-acetyltransferase n=1 Tax=Zeimonas sediminis TaxID=2944268 RepID=UPI002342EE29|nr:GNAT family N-acetyltransferase [Zeimonas sediminis]MCM5569259.1 GNAT family N-acetyltransferase [Zeimonas sediminis]